MQTYCGECSQCGKLFQLNWSGDNCNLCDGRIVAVSIYPQSVPPVCTAKWDDNSWATWHRQQSIVADRLHRYSKLFVLILLCIALSGCALSSSFTVSGDYAGQSYSYTVRGE